MELKLKLVSVTQNHLINAFLRKAYYPVHQLGCTSASATCNILRSLKHCLYYSDLLERHYTIFFPDITLSI